MAMSRPVDLDAFRTLASAADEQYLRDSLPPHQFRRVQRLRMRAAMEYVGRAAHNSSLLIRLGENARYSRDPQLVRVGADLANNALHMRLLCIGTLAVIVARIALPRLRLSIADICDRYAATCERVVTFGRLELPAQAGRIESAL